jgi:hypothetical protein
MSQKMVITLDEKTTARFLDIASRTTSAEIEANCLPSGVELKIAICPPFGNIVSIATEEIGEAEINLS